MASTSEPSDQQWLRVEEEPLRVTQTESEWYSTEPGEKTAQERLFGEISEAVTQHLHALKGFDLRIPPSSLAGRDLLPPAAFAPRYEEVEELSLDPSGSRRRLLPEELREVAATGQFSVASREFPGSYHVWRLSGLLQKGREGITGSWRSAVGRAWDQVLVKAPARVTGGRDGTEGPSVRGALKGVVGVGAQLVDQLVGLPQWKRELHDSDVIHRVEQQRLAFLFRNHDVSPIWTTPPESALASEQAFGSPPVDTCLPRRFSVREGFVDLEAPPPALDMRLSSPALQRAAAEVLERVVEELWVEWRLERDVFIRAAIARQRLPSEAGAGANEHISTESRQAVIESCVQHLDRRLCERVLASEALVTLGGAGLPQLVVSFLQVSAAISKSEKRAQEHRALHEDEIARQVGLRWRALSPEFVRREVARQMAEHDEHEMGRRLQCALDGLELHRLRFQGEGEARTLTQEYYLLDRNRTFRQMAPELTRSLNDRWIASRVFNFSRKIWFTRNMAAVMVHPGHQALGNDEEPEPQWAIIDSQNYSVSSSQPGWRLCNTLARSFVWTSNWLHWWFWENMVNGKLGLRSLLSPAPFPTRLRVNREGVIIPDQRSLQPTLWSRLKRLVTSSSDSVAAFEATPDTGILGKTMSRVFNRVWNYLFKVGVGSAGLCAVVIVLTVANVLASLAMVAGAVALMPAAAVLKYLLNYLLLDFDYSRRKDWWHAYSPCIQLPIRLFSNLTSLTLAVVMGSIGHPLLAASLFTTSSAVALTRLCYDGLIRFFILRPLARCPQRDTFLARRVAGPGLSFFHYQSITTDQVLLLLQVHLEGLLLEVVRASLTRRIQAPRLAFSRFLRPILGPFTGHASGPDAIGNRYLLLKEQELLSRLQQLLENSDIAHHRQRLTQLDLSRVRQTAEDLPRTLVQAELLTRDFVNRSMHPYMDEVERRQLFSSADLAEDDWDGLAGHFLKQVTSQEFLRPLDAGDTSVRLEITPTSQLREFVKMIKENNPRDDLESVFIEVLHSANELTAETQRVFNARCSGLGTWGNRYSDPILNACHPMAHQADMGWFGVLNILRDQHGVNPNP